jgi:transposase-like protein
MVLVLGMVPVYASAALPTPAGDYENDPATCTHEKGSLSAVYPNYDSLTHTFVWSCCGAAVVENHSRQQVGEPVPPTCLEYGYTEYYCEICGDVFWGDVVDPLEHVPGEVGFQEPTCTEIGYTYYVCQLCGQSIVTEVVSSLGHTPGQVVEVVAPTCEGEGYTRYICGTCGKTYTDDVVAPLGHSFMTNGICIQCGLDTATSIIITMSSAWGDGWAQNGIIVYEDGVEIGTATVETGDHAVWSYEMDPAKDYRFVWKDRQYAKKCAFTISIMGVEVFSAEYGDCETYFDSLQLYPFCDHNYEITDVMQPGCYGPGYTTYTCTLCGSHYDEYMDFAHSWDGGITVLPTCTEGGYTRYRCTLCGYSYTENLVEPSHSYGADGVCTVCGAVQPVKARGFSLSFEDEILVNLYFSVNDAAAVAQGMLAYNQKPEKPDAAAADRVYPAVYVPSSGRYMSQTDGIAAKEMGDTRYYVAYVQYADGTYAYSDVLDYSPAVYARNKLSNADTDPRLKALCAAMLSYGAAAQAFFGYRTDALMNEDLSFEDLMLLTAFGWDKLTGAVGCDKETVFNKTEGFSAISASVSFEGAFAVNYYFTPSVPADVTFYYWTAEDYAAADALTAETATGSMAMVMQENGTCWASLTGIAAKAIDDTVYVAAVCEQDGVTHSTGVIAYSISTYCRKQAGGSMGDLAYATAAYGYFAARYFAK